MAKLRIRLTPRGGRNALDRYEHGVLHARVSAPPVDGAANIALVDLLSRTLDVRKGAIIIVAGHSGREKRVEIAELTQEELNGRLDRALHGSAPR